MSEFERETTRRPSPADDSLQDELLAAYAASRELPSSQERAIVMSFLERLDRTLDARIDARINELVRQKKFTRKGATGTVGCSLALAIPLLAIAGSTAGSIGVIAVIAGIVILNVVALSRR